MQINYELCPFNLLRIAIGNNLDAIIYKNSDAKTKGKN